jgi:protein gp37
MGTSHTVLKAERVIQMSMHTKIAWADSSWNPWIGCTKISPACKHCYAESQNKRRNWNGGTWGPGAPRKVLSQSNWDAPLKWDRKAAEGMHGKDGKRWLVFGGDLCDTFDDEGPLDARDRMWRLMRSTPHLTWMLLTKRPENFKKYLPYDWGDGYSNVWLGVTCENREHGYPRVEILRNTPATMRFLSCEPLLEDISDIDLTGIN